MTTAVAPRPTPTTRTLTRHTARSIIAAWARSRVEEQPTHSIPDITNEALAHFTNDKTFMKRLIEEELRPIFYDIVQTASARTKGTDRVATAAGAISSEELESGAADFLRRFRWSENLRPGLSMHVQAMTGRDCLEAAAIRTRNGERELATATFFRYLGNKVKPDQPVGDVFSDDQLARLRTRIIEERAPITTLDAAAD